MKTLDITMIFIPPNSIELCDSIKVSQFSRRGHLMSIKHFTHLIQTKRRKFLLLEFES